MAKTLNEAQQHLEALREEQNRLIRELLPHCQGITPMEIQDVLDAIWVCGYKIVKD